MIDNYCTKNVVIVLFQRVGGKCIKEKRLIMNKLQSLAYQGLLTLNKREKIATALSNSWPIHRCLRRPL